MKFHFKTPHFFNQVMQFEKVFNDVTLVEFNEKTTKTKNSTAVLVSDKMDNSDVIRSMYKKKYHAILNKNSPYFVRDVMRTSSFICNPDVYFQDPLQVLFTDIPRTVRLNFNKKEDKNRILTEALDFFKEINSSLATESINAVLQEMFMNAVYDAPREAQKLNIPLTEKDSELMVAHDHDLIIISCVDYYGSLNIEKFSARLNLIVDQGAGSSINLDASVGGAGIGCFILFNQCLDMIVGVDPYKCTRFTCIFPVKMRQKQFNTITKNIQIIEKNNVALRSTHDTKTHKSKK